MKPTQRQMLERIAGATDRNGSLMQIAILSAGGGARTKLLKLIDAGWAETCDHELPAGPVPGIRVTAAGRAALGHN